MRLFRVYKGLFPLSLTTYVPGIRLNASRKGMRSISDNTKSSADEVLKLVNWWLILSQHPRFGGGMSLLKCIKGKVSNWDMRVNAS